MANETAKLIEYLAKFGCTELVAGKLSFGKHTFDAVAYTQDGQKRIYVVGERPPVLKRARKMAVQIGTPDDWYVAAYIEEPTNVRYHPLGANFLLCLWSVPSGDPIDKYNYWRGEHKLYLRIPASFQVGATEPAHQRLRVAAETTK